MGMLAVILSSTAVNNHVVHPLLEAPEIITFNLSF